MALFRRGKGTDSTPDPAPGPEDEVGANPSGDTELEDVETVEASRSFQPFAGLTDPADVTDHDAYVNLGALWIKGESGLQLQLEVNEETQQIVGVGALLGQTAIQLNVYAAPRTLGMWPEIRAEIAGKVAEAGGSHELVQGPFGTELRALLPAPGPGGSTVMAPVRFVGIDGPRWFLRASINGLGAVDPDAAPEVDALIASCVVDRGSEPMAPREVLPLTLPAGVEELADEPATADAAAATPAAKSTDDLNPFERGPEITEVR